MFVKKTGRKLHPAWLLGLLALIGIGWFVFQQVGINTRIIVSPQTTYITSPLGSDGLPDYAAYSFREGSREVTSANNAAVLLWKANWPGYLNPQQQILLCKALGMTVPEKSNRFETILEQCAQQAAAAWLSEHPNVSKKSIFDLEDAIAEIAVHRPWSSEELPPLASFVIRNQDLLDLASEASHRTQLFSPPISFLEGMNVSLYDQWNPLLGVVRDATESLSVRAMWHLGEARPDSAWNDLLACHRLARLTSLQSDLWDHLYAIRVSDLAIQGTITLLQSELLTEELAKEILSELEILPVLPPIAQKLEVETRIRFLDTIIRTSKGQDILNVPALQYAASLRVDWNNVLLEVNRWQDRLVAICRLPTRRNRQAKLEAYFDDLDSLFTEHGPLESLVGGIFSAQQRSDITTGIFLLHLMRPIEGAIIADERSKAYHQLMRTAAALAVFRLSHSKYPDQLAELVPELLARLPVDLYSKRPLVYQRKGEGYLLYSVLENGVDDGGTDYRGKIVRGEWVEGDDGVADYDQSDLVIRVPEPGFRLPVGE